MRHFDTGATRDTDQDKLDFEGFLSHDALTAFAEYMHKNRIQADGQLRDSDNWQKGIPREAYMKSAWRHFMQWWNAHRSDAKRAEKIEACCALLFNVQGYIHETLKNEPVEVKSALEKIRDGLHLAERPPTTIGVPSQSWVSWEEVMARRYPLTHDCGASEPVTHAQDEGLVDAVDWSVSCACGWAGSVDQLILDGTNRSCLCPDCCAPLLALHVELTPQEDEDNLYEQIGKAVALGLNYGAGLPKIMEIVENIYLKETS